MASIGWGRGFRLVEHWDGDDGRRCALVSGGCGFERLELLEHVPTTDVQAAAARIASRRDLLDAALRAPHAAILTLYEIREAPGGIVFGRQYRPGVGLEALLDRPLPEGLTVEVFGQLEELGALLDERPELPSPRAEAVSVGWDGKVHVELLSAEALLGEAVPARRARWASLCRRPEGSERSGPEALARWLEQTFPEGLARDRRRLEGRARRELEREGPIGLEVAERRGREVEGRRLAVEARRHAGRPARAGGEHAVDVRLDRGAGRARRRAADDEGPARGRDRRQLPLDVVGAAALVPRRPDGPPDGRVRAREDPGPRHFQEANEDLLRAMEADPDFAGLMRSNGINLERTATGLAPRRPPRGWTWHHERAPGEMRLVPLAQHTPESAF